MLLSFHSAEHISPPTPKVLNSPYALILEVTFTIDIMHYTYICVCVYIYLSQNLKD